MSPEPSDGKIVGIDKPAGSRRPRWWQLLLALILAILVVAWVADALHESEEERVASTVKRFLDSYADRDGGEFCEVLTEEGQAEVVSSSLVLGGGESCEEGASAQIEALEETGAPLDDAGEVAERDIEDRVEVDGDSATVDLDSPLTSAAFELVREDGEWLIALESFETGPADQLPEDASSEDLIAAADRICIAAFGNSSVALGELVDAAKGGDRGGVRGALGEFEDSESQLLLDLEQLAEGREEPALEELIAAQRTMVSAVEGIGPGGTGFAAVTAANRKLAMTAAEAGFAEFGCAAPPATSP